VIDDHYLTMLLCPGATADEVRTQWKKLASELHPDKLAGKSEKIVRHATDRFAELSGAYACLSDPKKRAAFDFERAVGKDRCPACEGLGRTARRGLKGAKYTGCSTCECSGLVEAKKKGKRK
jgi:DnaJ-class molecular chaperone